MPGLNEIIKCTTLSTVLGKGSINGNITIWKKHQECQGQHPVGICVGHREHVVLVRKWKLEFM